MNGEVFFTANLLRQMNSRGGDRIDVRDDFFHLSVPQWLSFFFMYETSQTRVYGSNMHFYP